MTSFAALPRPTAELSIDGFHLGQAEDLTALTGVTVVLFPEGAVAAADVRGTATGTRQFDSLINPLHLATRAHGLVLAGGSGAGLGAADAVVEHLAAHGAGFDTGVVKVPLVPTAILFDLALGTPIAPSRELVSRALARAAAGPVATGNVGAGTGATVGKALGLAQAMKGGLGFASLTVAGGVTVAAVAAVNAYGDVRDPENGQLVAGCRTAPESLELADATRVFASLPPASVHRWEQNTTLVAVLTDAALSKSECLKVCQMAFGGLHRALSPALSLYDGDLVATFALPRRPAHVHQVGMLAQRAVEAAILSGVREASGLPGLPAARDLQR